MTETDTVAALVVRMRDAAQKATPGPWFQTGSPWYRDGSGVVAGSPDGNVAPLIVDTACFFERTDYEGPFTTSDPEDDAAHIAASNPASVLSLIAAYEAERERANCAEQSESELVQGAKDLDLQIEDLRAERDALAELLRRAGEGLTPFVKWSKPERDFADELTDHLVSYGDEMEIDMSDFAGDPANPLLWGDLSRARSILADIEARLPKPTSPPA